MGQDNRDRYGYRHRRDEQYESGESMPGNVGDSQGTFYDRASSDNNIIVDGKATNFEDYERSQRNIGTSQSDKGPQKSDESKKTVLTVRVSRKKR